MERTIITVSDQENDIRLDRLIKRYYPSISQGIIEKSLRKNLIKIDDKKTQSNYRVQTNQVISVAAIIIPENIAEKLKKKISAYIIKDFRQSIIFYNQDIIAINKPSGLATQGGSNIAYSVDDLIKNIAEFNDLDPKLVHRLDKDTSGVLIIASNVYSANLLTKYFREKIVKKKYLALVLGKPKEDQGTIDISLTKFYENNSKKIISSKDGDQAITKYKVIDNISDKLSLVEFTPITGRTHQIRIHAKLTNMPIVGDKKYGYFDSDLMINQNILHLHSWEINIDDIRGQKYHFTAPIPKHMQDNIKALGLRIK